MERSWWVTSDNACEPGEQLIVLANGDDESDLVGWSLLLLAATVRSFAHMPLGISYRNKCSLAAADVSCKAASWILFRERQLATAFINPLCLWMFRGVVVLRAPQRVGDFTILELNFEWETIKDQRNFMFSHQSHGILWRGWIIGYLHNKSLQFMFFLQKVERFLIALAV